MSDKVQSIPLEEALPGYYEALKLGFTLKVHTGDRNAATYQKSDKVLDIVRLGSDVFTTLHAYPYRLVHVEIPRFSFPNSNFPIFERQMDDVLLWIALHD